MVLEADPIVRGVEKAFIGAVFLDNGCLPEGIAAHGLVEEDFEDERNGLIFRVMLGLMRRNEPIDEVTVVNELHTFDKLGIAGPLYVASLVEQVPTASNAKAYAARIKGYSHVRRKWRQIEKE